MLHWEESSICWTIDRSLRPWQDPGRSHPITEAFPLVISHPGVEHRELLRESEIGRGHLGEDWYEDVPSP